jgi:hypothetical protein
MTDVNRFWKILASLHITRNKKTAIILNITSHITTTSKLVMEPNRPTEGSIHGDKTEKPPSLLCLNDKVFGHSGDIIQFHGAVLIEKLIAVQPVKKFSAFY